MQDRRRVARGRSYLGARIAFNGRASVADCLVRDFGPRGAGVAMSNTVMLPDIVDFEIACRGLSTRARVVWRTQDRLGLAFVEPGGAGTGSAAVVSIATARRLRDLEAENAALRRRVADLAGEA